MTGTVGGGVSWEGVVACAPRSACLPETSRGPIQAGRQLQKAPPAQADWPKGAGLAVRGVQTPPRGTALPRRVGRTSSRRPQSRLSPSASTTARPTGWNLAAHRATGGRGRQLALGRLGPASTRVRRSLTPQGHRRLATQPADFRHWGEMRLAAMPSRPRHAEPAHFWLAPLCPRTSSSGLPPPHPADGKVGPSRHGMRSIRPWSLLGLRLTNPVDASGTVLK